MAYADSLDLLAAESDAADFDEPRLAAARAVDASTRPLPAK